LTDPKRLVDSARAMEVEHADDDLERLEHDPEFTAGHAQAIVKAFRKVMQVIRAATDERTFYALRSLHFEKLKGNREGERSMRLNDQWRLILRIKEEKDSPKVVVVLSIEDYH
jgi:toxin HigB-1